MTTLKKIKWLTIAILVVSATPLLVHPFETTIVPEWRVQVRDESGKPIKGTPIREVWSHHPIDSSHEEDLLTDLDGYVSFPRRTARANLLIRTVKTTINKFNVHGSSGPVAYLLVVGDYKPVNDEPLYRPGRPLATQIVVRH